MKTELASRVLEVPSLKSRIAVLKAQPFVAPVKLLSITQDRDRDERILGSFNHQFDALENNLGRVIT